MTGAEADGTALAIVIMTFAWNAQGIRLLPAFLLSVAMVAIGWASYLNLPSVH